MAREVLCGPASCWSSQVSFREVLTGLYFSPNECPSFLHSNEAPSRPLPEDGFFCARSSAKPTLAIRGGSASVSAIRDPERPTCVYPVLNNDICGGVV